jgi:hypothetical protein
MNINPLNGSDKVAMAELMTHTATLIESAIGESSRNKRLVTTTVYNVAIAVQFVVARYGEAVDMQISIVNNNAIILAFTQDTKRQRVFFIDLRGE